MRIFQVGIFFRFYLYLTSADCLERKQWSSCLGPVCPPAAAGRVAETLPSLRFLGKTRAFPPQPSKDIRFTSVRSDPWNATGKIMLGFVLSDLKLKKSICRRPIVYERQSENGDQLNSDNQLVVSKLIQCNNSLLLVCSTAPHLSHSSH